MTSISFPNMFGNSRTATLSGKDAVLSNLKTLLATQKKSLYGDPYYGTNLHSMLFEQNNVVLQDLVIDAIYTAIATFMPQVSISRNDIKVYSKGTNIYATIRCVNIEDYTTNMYEINLTSSEEI